MSEFPNYPFGDNVVRPFIIRDILTVPCLPLGICQTCREDTKGYHETCCESCARGYTRAFLLIAQDMFRNDVK